MIMRSFHKLDSSNGIKMIIVQELEKFFSELNNVLPSKIDVPATPSYLHLSNLSNFEQWLTNIAEPIQTAKRGGFLCDPWEIAGLKRDEVRNSRVLAWLLDPRGSHGFGNLLTHALLAELSRRSPTLELPVISDDGCQVRVESSPDGDSSNRLDIEIDSPNFYVIIEVKIDAMEGNEQLLRYGELGKSRAGNRPWGMVFLTPSGFDCSTAAHFKDKVIRLSWKQLSSALSGMLRIQYKRALQVRSQEKLTLLLAQRFLKHVRNF
jgi:hypothetical protein